MATLKKVLTDIAIEAAKNKHVIWSEPELLNLLRETGELSVLLASLHGSIDLLSALKQVFKTGEIYNLRELTSKYECYVETFRSEGRIHFIAVTYTYPGV